MGPTAIAFHRVLWGGLLLLLYARLRGISLRVPRRVLWACVLAGLFFAGDLFSWHRAILSIGAGLSTLLANTQVVWVSLVGVLVLGERGGPRLLVQLVLAVVGVALLLDVFGHGDAPPPDGAGFALGIATGLFYTGYILSLRGAGAERRGIHPVAVMVYASLATAVFLLGLSVGFDESLAVPDLATAGVLAALALLVQGVGWVVLSAALPRIPAAVGGLLLLLQPTLATLWGVAIYQEPFGWLNALGSSLVLVAIYLGASRRRPPPASPTAGERAQA